jgi:ABC-type multidrug transport system fused ATPase/permease subunit
LGAIKKLAEMLNAHERKRALMLFGLVVVMALLEVVGVASVMPFMAVMANPEVVETNAFLAAVYNTLGFTDTRSYLSFLGLIVFVALVSSIAFKALTTYALLRFTNMRGYSLCRRLVGGYLNQPYEWFLNRNSADLSKTVLAEVQQVISGGLIPAMQLIANGAVVIALLLLLIAADPVLASGVGLGLGLAYGVIYMGLRRFLGRIGADRVLANRGRYQSLNEAFGGIKDVKVSGLEGVFLRRFEGPALRYARHMSASSIATQLPRYALEIIAFGGIMLVALYLLSADGGLETALPILALYALAGYRMMPAVQTVYAELTKLRFAEAALDTLHHDLTTLGMASTTKEIIEPMKLEDQVELRSVSYSYPAGPRAAIESLDIAFAARTRIGLVGATGSGKTTTVDIVLGLLEPASGQLVVDGVPITRENVGSWQRAIGYVPQNIYLSDDTIAGNIAFGTAPSKIDRAAVERAGRIANLHDFVANDLPERYDTVVGERGVRLSGGQRQRIGIARALYHNPHVLVLDEATSALDNLTEQAVMEAMDNLGHEITIILIAHRLSTVRSCDHIYLLDRGRLAGQGTYDELVAGNDSFRRMAGASR